MNPSTLIQGFFLSPVQHRAWALSRIPGQRHLAAYALLALDGPVVPVRLRESLAKVQARHEILRTRFQVAEGTTTPLQVIADADEAEFEFIHTTGNLAEELMAACPAGVFSAHLHSESETKHQLRLSAPALACDPTSLWLIAEEACGNYAGVPQTGSDPIQFADVAQYQNEIFDSEEAALGLAFWRDHDWTQGGDSVERYSPAAVNVELPPDLVRALRSAALQNGVEFSDWMLTFWTAFLRRAKGVANIIVGLHASGRTIPQFDRAVGPYDRCVPLLCEAGESGTLTVLSRAITQNRELILARQDFFRWTDAESATVPRCFRFGFEYLDARPVLTLEHTSCRLLELGGHLECEELRLECRLDECAPGARLIYDSNRTDPKEAEALAARFTALLRSSIENPNARVNELAMLGKNDKQAIAALNEGTEVAWEERLPIDLFEDYAALAPFSTAARCGDKKLNFAALNKRASQIAYHLRQLGAGPEVRVAILMRRSIEMIAAVLGVMKSGSAYAPIDGQSPDSRLRFIFDDAQPWITLTDDNYERRVPGDCSNIINVSREAKRLDAYGDVSIRSEAVGNGLAYVIYTSGSTGAPKGVMVSNSSLSNYLCWSSTAYQVAAGSGSLLHSPLAFDLTVTALLTPLSAGCGVEIVEEGEQHEGLAELLKRQRGLSLLKLTPAHLEALSEQLEPGEAKGRVNVIVVGGEALRGRSVRFWQEHSPETVIINEYGPTETVVGCCVYALNGGRYIGEADIPIGRPIANTRLYILDEAWHPVAPGMAGELFIGGSGVARGYWRRPESTAERFVPDPFAREIGARFYRTGDIVRLRDTGDLEYLGRNDDQVKVRGYRIELGEVETALRNCPNVHRAAVIPTTGQAGNTRLVAFIVVSPNCTFDEETIRRQLKSTLTDYMMPWKIISIPEMPLTLNGKVDRSRIPLLCGVGA